MEFLLSKFIYRRKCKNSGFNGRLFRLRVNTASFPPVKVEFAPFRDPHEFPGNSALLRGNDRLSPWLFPKQTERIVFHVEANCDSLNLVKMYQMRIYRELPVHYEFNTSIAYYSHIVPLLEKLLVPFPDLKIYIKDLNVIP